VFVWLCMWMYAFICTQVDLCVCVCMRVCGRACVHNMKETQILLFKIFGLYLHTYVAFRLYAHCLPELGCGQGYVSGYFHRHRDIGAH